MTVPSPFVRSIAPRAKARLDSVVRLFMFALGAGLLAEGGLLLLVGGAQSGLASLNLPFATGDVRHNALHAIWGAAILLTMWRTRWPRRDTALALVFGVFYSALAVAGIAMHDPLGLVLGPGENAFHVIVGSLALALGLWSLAQPAGGASRSSATRAAAVASTSSESTSAG